MLGQTRMTLAARAAIAEVNSRKYKLWHGLDAKIAVIIETLPQGVEWGSRRVALWSYGVTEDSEARKEYIETVNKKIEQLGGRKEVNIVLEWINEARFEFDKESARLSKKIDIIEDRCERPRAQELDTKRRFVHS